MTNSQNKYSGSNGKIARTCGTRLLSIMVVSGRDLATGVCQVVTGQTKNQFRPQDILRHCAQRSGNAMKYHYYTFQ